MHARRWAYGLARKAVTFVAAFVVLGLTLCVSAQRDAYAQGAGEAGTRASAPVQAMPPSAPAAGASQVPTRPRIIGINNRRQTIPYKLSADTLGPNGLWLVVSQSPTLTAMLRQDMLKRGYQLAASPQSASSWMTVYVAMTLEAKGRQLNVNLPAIVEKNAHDDPDLQRALADASANRSFVLPLDGWGSKIVNNVGGPSLGMSVFAIGNFFEATGLAAKFNEWTVGDARGICLAKLLGMSCPMFDATIHHTRLTILFRPMGATREQTLKGEVLAASYIPTTDLGLAFLLAWSDFSRALNGKEIGPCNDRKPENCMPDMEVAQ
jgi:hypothetical protein